MTRTNLRAGPPEGTYSEEKYVLQLWFFSRKSSFFIFQHSGRNVPEIELPTML